MIRVRDNRTNRDILVLWRHEIPQVITPDKLDIRRSRLNKSKEVIGSTTCTICDDNRDSIILEQVALKSKHDQFNRKVGRNVSFRRAMNYLRDNDVIDKRTRAEIWNKFFETGGLKVNI